MSCRFETLLCHVDCLILQFWITVLSISLLCTSLPVQAQTDCSAYNQCAPLQEESGAKLNGPMTYSFDEASLNALPTEQARQDFKTRIIAAANDWAAKTGVSITLTQSAQASSHVTVQVSTDPNIRASKGLAGAPAFPPGNTQRHLLFSDSFSTWSGDGKNWIASHEWGHIMGLASIDLDYKESKRVDEYGNQLGYRAKVRDVAGAQVGRWAWDVFLVSGSSSPQ